MPSTLIVDIIDWVTAVRIYLSEAIDLSKIFFKNLTLRLSTLILTRLKDREIIGCLSYRLMLSGKEKSYLLKVSRLTVR